MKKIFFCISAFLCAGLAFSQHSFTLEISGAKNQGGKIYVSVFNSEYAYDAKKVTYSLVTNAGAEIVHLPIALPAGEYLFSMFQDSNGNGKLDTNLIGIPREPFGFSNYSGKSAPGNFDKLKVIVNDKTKKIAVLLYKI